MYGVLESSFPAFYRLKVDFIGGLKISQCSKCARALNPLPSRQRNNANVVLTEDLLFIALERVSQPRLKQNL